MTLCACNGSSYRSLGRASCLNLQRLNCPRKGSFRQLRFWKRKQPCTNRQVIVYWKTFLFLLGIPNSRKFLLERGRIRKCCVTLILLKFWKHLIYTLRFWIRQKDAEAIKTYNYLKNSLLISVTVRSSSVLASISENLSSWHFNQLCNLHFKWNESTSHQVADYLVIKSPVNCLAYDTPNRSL
jgi:hypothetical protein